MRGPNSDSAQRAERQRRAAQQRRIDQFLLGEKPALILTMNANGSDGTIFVSGGGSYAKDAPEYQESFAVVRE